jgi:hypothetical protein
MPLDDSGCVTFLEELEDTVDLLTVDINMVLHS